MAQDKYRVTQNKVTKRFRIEELDTVSEVYRPMPLEKVHVFFSDAVNRIIVLKDRDAEEPACNWVPVVVQYLKKSSRFNG